jgi:predicted nucleic acid-binding Zn ribbon protein
MPSLGGLRPPEVPCVRCGERVPGLGWGERCRDCLADRKRRARRLARRISLVAALLTATALGLQAPRAADARVWIAIGTVATFLLVRTIVQRVAMEFLKD